MPPNKNAIKATYIDRTHNKIHSKHQTCELEVKVMETMFFSFFQNKKFCLITAPIIKGSLVEKLPSYGDLKMQRVQYSSSSSSSAK